MKQFLLSFGFLAILFVCLAANNVYAVTAYPHPVEYKLPDGTTLSIVLKGDEKVNWAETLDGYSILLNDKGYYEYAILNEKGDMERSGIRVSPKNKRSADEQVLLSKIKKGIMYSPSQVSIMQQIWDINEKEASKAFPTTGDRKLICILVNFTDVQFQKTQADFDALFNQVGYNVDGATGSVKDYYLENSYGQFNLTVDVAGPYTVSQNMAYYGGESGDPRPMVTEVVGLADADVDFSDYDNDNDGSVDGVYIIFAGYGEEAGASEDAIWSHAWSIWPAVNYDGVEISRYSCSPELRGNSGTNLTRIGVICHEFGHVLGAPDYYDTNYNNTGDGQFSGTGRWDMMAGGSWNNGGATPAHHNAFTKVVYYNWAEATVLESSTTVTMENGAENSGSFYRVNTQTANEYFLLENREKHLFDAAIPGSGLIIYHVHSGVFSVGNSINVTHPQRMYPVAQNATSDPTSDPSSYGNINDATCAWTGTGKSEFTDFSTPSALSWAGVNTEKPITGITRDAATKTVTFHFMGGAQGNPANFNAEAISTSRIDLSWNLNDDSNPVVIAWSADGQFGSLNDGTTYSAGSSIDGGGTVLYAGSNLSFQHSGLSPNTAYYYKAWSLLNDDTYSPGTIAYTSTLCGVISTLPFTEDFDAAQTLPTCWTNLDNAGSGQVWQFGSHSDGLSGSTGNYAYLNSDAYGSGSSQNADLISPNFDLSSYTDVTLSFSHYFKEWTGSSASVSYSIDGGNSWSQIDAWSSNTTNPTAFSELIPEVSGQSNVKFKWNYTGSWGYFWDIDDIEITGVIANPQTLSVNIEGNGTVFANGNAYSGPISYNQGVSVQLEAIADEGWQFAGWSGDISSTNEQYNFTINDNTSITATFTELPQYTLSVSVVGSGSIELNGSPYSNPVVYTSVTEVNLAATPLPGWQFAGWSGHIESTEQAISFDVEQDVDLIATFSEATAVSSDAFNGVMVYPNPFTDKIWVTNAEAVSRITIVNLIGQVVFSVEPAGDDIVEITSKSMSNGIYLMVMYSNNGQKQIKKIVKNN